MNDHPLAAMRARHMHFGADLPLSFTCYDRCDDAFLSAMGVGATVAFDLNDSGFDKLFTRTGICFVRKRPGQKPKLPFPL